jgi:hypothetical protein
VTQGDEVVLNKMMKVSMKACRAVLEQMMQGIRIPEETETKRQIEDKNVRV